MPHQQSGRVLARLTYDRRHRRSRVAVTTARRRGPVAVPPQSCRARRRFPQSLHPPLQRGRRRATRSRRTSSARRAWAPAGRARRSSTRSSRRGGPSARARRRGEERSGGEKDGRTRSKAPSRVPPHTMRSGSSRRVTTARCGTARTVVREGRSLARVVGTAGLARVCADRDFVVTAHGSYRLLATRRHTLVTNFKLRVSTGRETTVRPRSGSRRARAPRRPRRCSGATRGFPRAARRGGACRARRLATVTRAR